MTFSVGSTWSYLTDPSVGGGVSYDGYDSPSPLEALQQQIFGRTGAFGIWGNLSGITQNYMREQSTAHSYVYVNGQPVADVSRESTLSLKSLEIDQAQLTAVKEQQPDADGWPAYVTVGYDATLQASDLQYDSAGNLDRQATAEAVAHRLFTVTTDSLWGAPQAPSII